MKKILAITLTCCSMLAYSNIGTRGFSDYLNEYFVETGTFGGDATLRALKDGFKYVRTVEAHPGLFKNARHRLKDYANVQVWNGDSATVLWPMIKNIKKPITFWLDAHVYPPHAESKNCPLIEELEQIKRHPIKTHTILIDDMSCCDSLAFDFLSREDIIAKIKEINEDYEISYIPGGNDDEVQNNIMVARVKNK